MVNDGSKDSSLSICKEYAQANKNIKVIDKPNGGASSARNAALDVVLGEWITFCDSDDFVDPDWLENFVAGGLDKYSLIVQSFSTYHPFALSADNHVNSNGFRPVRIKEGVFTTEEAIGLMREVKTLGYTWCKLFKASVIERHNLRFQEGITFREDDLFVIEYMSLVSGEKVLFTDKAAYKYYMPDWSKYNDMKGFAIQTMKVLSEKYSLYDSQSKIYAVDRAFDLVIEAFRRKASIRMELIRKFRTFCKEKNVSNIPTDHRLNKLSQKILRVPGTDWIVYLMMSLKKL